MANWRPADGICESLQVRVSVAKNWTRLMGTREGEEDGQGRYFRELVPVKNSPSWAIVYAVSNNETFEGLLEPSVSDK